MILHTAAAPPFFKNGFVLGCERTREAVYIDPGDEVEELLTAIAAAGLHVVAIPLTHAHVDHVSGVARARRALGAPIWLHRDDLFLYDSAVSHGALFGLRVEAPPPVDRYYAADPRSTESEMRFGDYDVFVRHTPGHCPGGVCLAVTSRTAAPAHAGAPAPPHRRTGDSWDLFVGDTLFAGSIGRTDLPGGDFDTLMRSITEVLFAFGDEARVHSGHGPGTTIGDERRTNPFVLEWLSSRAR